MRNALLILCFMPALLFAQISALQGTVTDETGEALIGATVKVLADSGVVRGSITDPEGHYRIMLGPGNYRAEVSYTGYKLLRISNIRVIAGQINVVDFVMPDNDEIGPPAIIYRCPRPSLIDQVPGNTGTTLSSGQLRRFF